MNCSSPPAHCLLQGIHLLCPQKKGDIAQWPQEGTHIKMTLWRREEQTGRCGGIAYVIKYKLLQKLEKAF